MRLISWVEKKLAVIVAGVVVVLGGATAAAADDGTEIEGAGGQLEAEQAGTAENIWHTSDLFPDDDGDPPAPTIQ